MEYLRYEISENIAIITIDRPKALNALNRPLLEELYEMVDRLDRDPEVKVMILTGYGEKAFAAGADIGVMRDMRPEDALEWGRMGHKTMDRIAKADKIVIAAVNGYALGGGCELALACDIRVGSTKAQMGIPEVTLGTIPGFGGTQRLSRLVGLGVAMELLATGRQVRAEEALRIGLLNRVTEPEELLSSAVELAKKIAKNSISAVIMGKRCMCQGLEMDLERAQELERNCFALTFSTIDQKEGMNAFLEKRKPIFQ